jgi:hypothetical protein
MTQRDITYYYRLRKSCEELVMLQGIVDPRKLSKLVKNIAIQAAEAQAEEVEVLQRFLNFEEIKND